MRCPEQIGGKTAVDLAAESALQLLDEMLYRFDGMEAMKKYFEENKDKKTIFDFDMSNTEDQRKNLLVALFNQKLTNKMCSQDLEFFETLKATLKSKYPSSEPNPFLDDLLTKIPLIMANLKWKYSATLKDQTFDKIGDNTKVPGQYTSRSYGSIDPYEVLLAEDGAPTFMKFAVGDKTAWLINRPLSAGQKLSCANSQFIN